LLTVLVHSQLSLTHLLFHMSWNKRSHQSDCVLRILTSAVMVLMHRRGCVAQQKRAIRAVQAHTQTLLHPSHSPKWVIQLL
jgi:hypothetical protein